MRIAAEIGVPRTTIHKWADTDPDGPWPRLKPGKPFRIDWPGLRAALLAGQELVRALVDAGLLAAPLRGREPDRRALLHAVWTARQRFRRNGWPLPPQLAPVAPGGRRPLLARIRRAGGAAGAAGAEAAK